ncbi:hypothetical protein DH2020_004053 [Rehmannia glutinosa]|uniref:DOG1 domain-containing protein n=1 Tax=Rehmannia glutinosa TaxID=99300 RepID=A0ABR0XNG9_REHGL
MNISRAKMFKSFPFGRKKNTTKPFIDFYNNWINTLSTTLLPQLRRVLSSFSVSPALLSAHVDGMHHHFHSYYLALDATAASDVAQCLYPEWRNAVEKPFLWLGDLHPYLFTDLLQSVTMVYQAALFFEAVAQFLVGIRDSKLLKEFEDCEKAIN